MSGLLLPPDEFCPACGSPRSFRTCDQCGWNPDRLPSQALADPRIAYLATMDTGYLRG